MYKSLATGAIGVRCRPFPGGEALAAAHGFAPCTSDLTEIEQLGVERARAILADAGVRPAAFGLPVNCEGADKDFTEGLARLRDLAPLAQSLGIERTSTWVPSWHDTLSYRQNYDWRRERYRQVASVLAGTASGWAWSSSAPSTTASAASTSSSTLPTPCCSYAGISARATSVCSTTPSTGTRPVAPLPT